jgi:NAD(P)-dependent dehydrogenase (short-subunit alcohol dehydrogenase family)
MLRAFLFVAATAIVGWTLGRLYRTSRYKLRGRVALITGGSRGLGLVLARQICAQGGKVTLLARDAAELARAKDDLTGRGGEVLTIPCDLAEPGQIQSAVAQALARFGKIDILVNNAGIIEIGPFHHMQREDFLRAMQIHFWGPFELVREIVPSLRKNGGGRIVNISSIGGKVAVPHMSPYSASKFALTGFSDSIRAELARDNIRVTTVAPGLLRTGSHVNARTKGQHDAEFAWFAVSASAPVLSMSAERAARKILAACRRGQPSLTLTFAARFAIAGNALFPNLTGYAMRVANRFLPGPAEAGGDEARTGWESRQRNVLPGFLTRLSDAATLRNNEQTPP